MVKAKVFKYANVFDGPPKITDFELIEEDLPELADEGMIWCAYGKLFISYFLHTLIHPMYFLVVLVLCIRAVFYEYWKYTYKDSIYLLKPF